MTDSGCLYLRGNGLRALSHELNTIGLRDRKRRMFGSNLVHQILTRTAYKGVHHFNKRHHETRQLKDLLSAKTLERFAVAARERLHDPNSRFRRQYLRQFLDRVVVDDREVRIYGTKHALVEGILETGEPGNDLVPSSVPEVVVQGVSSEPVSVDFPVVQGEYREFYGIM